MCEFNVGELIKELGKFPPSARVRITWEGMSKSIFAGNIYQVPTGEVLLDGDDNTYKEAYMSGKYPTGG
jgi:hypothetical protein